MVSGDDRTRFSLAEDVGGIELLYASYQEHRLPPHFHDTYSISVSLRGGLAFDHRGSKHTAPSGVISAIEPYEVHNAYAAGGDGWAFLGFLVPLDVVSELSGIKGLPGLPQRIVCDPDMTRRFVILHYRLETSHETLERQSATILALTSFFHRHSTAQRAVRRVSREQGAVQRARELLHDCHTERIALNQLSVHAGLSPFHFLRVFRAEVGLTPHAYLNQIRILKAKRKLAAGMPLAQVALECGFCDQSHFARVFRGITGITPGQYRYSVSSTNRSTGIE